MCADFLFSAITFDGFDYLAFLVFAVLVGVAVVVIIFVGGLPGKVARRRNHPHANAITAAGWISLITLGALWPIAFVWAFVPPRTHLTSSDGGPTK